MASGFVVVTDKGIFGLGGTEAEALEQARALSPHCISEPSLRVEPASRGAITVLNRNPWTAHGGFWIAGVECLDGFWIRERIQFEGERMAPIAPAVTPKARPAPSRVIALARLRLEAAALEYALGANEESHGALLSAAIGWGSAVRSEAKAELTKADTWTVPAAEGSKS